MRDERESKEYRSVRKLKMYYLYFGFGITTIVMTLIIIYMDKNAEDSNYIRYRDSKKSLYVWNYTNAEHFIDFLMYHNFNRIYLYIGCIQWNFEDLQQGNFIKTGETSPNDLIKQLLNNNIEVYLSIYLNDDPDDFSNSEKIPDVVRELAQRLQNNILRFTGIHLDLNPKSEANFEKLLRIYDNCGHPNLDISASLNPTWENLNMNILAANFTDHIFYKKFKNFANFKDAIMSLTKYSALTINYNPLQGIDNLKQLSNIAKRKNSNINTLILKFDDKNEENELFFSSNENKNTFFKDFMDLYEGFNDITIQYYETWYKYLYCEKPKKEVYYRYTKDCEYKNP